MSKISQAEWQTFAAGGRLPDRPAKVRTSRVPTTMVPTPVVRTGRVQPPVVTPIPPGARIQGVIAAIVLAMVLAIAVFIVQAAANHKDVSETYPCSENPVTQRLECV